MATAPLPPALPLSPEQLSTLERVTGALDGPGLWWLSGYAAGLARGRAGLQPVAAAHAVEGASLESIPAEAADGARLTIVYGSQTGNARRVAEALAAQCGGEGLSVRLLRADAYQTRELKDERYLAIVISTQGDGDPPDDAIGFVEFLEGRRAPELPQLKFAVLGLGDSSYPKFCAIGQRLDTRLEALGASRWLPRADADVDLDTVASPWREGVLGQAREALKPRPQALANVTPLRPHGLPASPSAHAGEVWTRERPYPAELILNQRITATAPERAASDKDIRHLELALAEAGLDYAPGDALGVWARNPPALVEALLQALRLDGEAAVTNGSDTLPLREWLSAKREITRLSRPFVAAHAERSGDAALQALLVPEAQPALAALLAAQQPLDLLRAHPGDWSGEALVAALRPLQPRMYSIASSRSVVGEEAHLTVAHIQYAHDGELRWGAGSHFLASAEEGAQIPVFIERNERFRLPQDTSRDILMIGPGTGVAPFRGFVQEREASGATGRNWLFFGNPHARSDFLYQTEWQDALRRGALQRIDLAFSRDQAEKVYVQHRLRERGREVFDWLEGGAHLYVCGDATRMAKDVHAALLDIIATHGGKSAEDAADYLSDLQRQGRYARDVY